MLRRRFLPWLFALVLLFGQAAAFGHALTHLQDEDPALSDPVCEMCVAQAHLGSAAVATAFHLTLDRGHPPLASASGKPFVAGPIHHAHARAPPAAI